ncbi:MAG: hypothetical protein AAGA03_01715 [Planctomycetota bacterium]
MTTTMLAQNCNAQPWNYPVGRRFGFSATLLLLSFSAAATQADDVVTDSSPLQIFEQRIMPIFRSPKPSSCVQCHLSSVDIKDYILPSHEETFVALRDAGLINLETPQQSKILKLIRMGDQDADAKARRIHAKTRKAEHAAFAAWIEACCRQPELQNAESPSDASAVGPQKPLEVVRHARKSRLVESFTRHVWSQRMRCFPCHTPDEIDAQNPKHKKAAQNHQKLVKQYGAKMNLFQATPEATLDRMIAASRKQSAKRYPLLNLSSPAKSLLVLKPTAKLPPKREDGSLSDPSSSDPVSHMGGLKMHVNDHSYKSIVAWIQDYANVVGDQYASVGDLPEDNWVPTQRILRAIEVPESWGQGSVVQMTVHAPAKDRKDDSDRLEWSELPVAFTQGTITPRRIVNGALIMFRSRIKHDVQDQDVGPESFPLAPGTYLIKIFVDKSEQITSDPARMLNDSDFVGQALIQANWKPGFRDAEKFSAKAINTNSN